MSKNNRTLSKLFNEHITAVTEKSGKPRKQVRDARNPFSPAFAEKAGKKG